MIGLGTNDFIVLSYSNSQKSHILENQAAVNAITMQTLRTSYLWKSGCIMRCVSVHTLSASVTPPHTTFYGGASALEEPS